MPRPRPRTPRRGPEALKKLRKKKKQAEKYAVSGFRVSDQAEPMHPGPRPE